MHEVVAFEDDHQVFSFHIAADDDEAAEETVAMLNSTAHPDINFKLSETVA
ncbi:hypothetical protein N5923_23515 [Erwiniaceae bacterium BAC15a-03b]|uniref:Uncharacterized protein n=1 Tax=Winslowiella arboricola TaxID=2978220 RepID=A0A9J6PQ79_9GAMM|nr:hypothetical protein [Winslowiella arboricola]MCU5775081.1 hypothetical protein [Winslowiella arboricola]MCU5780465.1 hypothetical protein [Winslowiella arboricola]